MKDERLILAAGLIVAFIVYRLGKVEGKEGSGSAGSLATCESLNTDHEINAAAGDIRSIFQNEWFYSDEDEQRVKVAFSSILDLCAAKKLYKSFGLFSTTFYGDGDLDYWMSKLSEPTKVYCRKFTYGISNF